MRRTIENDFELTGPISRGDWETVERHGVTIDCTRLHEEVGYRPRSTVETVFLMPHEKYTYISSRLIKEVASLGAPITGMVPPAVEARLAQKFFGK